MSWEVIKHYKYRTATLVGDKVVNLPSEPFAHFHQMCSEMVGLTMPDNHEVYIVRADLSGDFAVWFHDGTMAIGQHSDVDEEGYNYD